MAIQVSVRKNGPYLIQGDLAELNLTDADGNPYDFAGKSMTALCRCGASATKPFCDGQHAKIGFEAAESAIGDN